MPGLATADDPARPTTLWAASAAPAGMDEAAVRVGVDQALDAKSYQDGWKGRNLAMGTTRTSISEPSHSATLHVR